MRWQSDNDDQKAYRAAKSRLAAIRHRQEARDLKDHLAMRWDEQDMPRTTYDLAGD